MRIRRAVPSDTDDIRTVHLLAFPTAAEADLVEQLVRDGDAVISMVAVEHGGIVGHILLSRMDVEADGRRLNAVGLAPVSVIPDLQRRGIGSALIVAAIAEARTARSDIIFVLGDTRFYRKFGFDAATARPFASPYAGPHFQALLMNPAMPPVEAGAASYPQAFDAL
jgi:putative acetyltransferase